MKALSLVKFIALVLAHRASAANGPCAAEWNEYGNCICIDHNLCTETYGGDANAGYPGNYPCPNDPANVWACSVPTCYGARTECTWSSSCSGTKLPSKKTKTLLQRSC
jgi:hypothetical protein